MRSKIISKTFREQYADALDREIIKYFKVLSIEGVNVKILSVNFTSEIGWLIKSYTLELEGEESIARRAANV